MVKRKKTAILTTSAALFLAAALTVFAQTSSVLLPASDGNYKQFTPKSGTTHYTMVDESSCNGTTDYNYTNTVGYRDSYGVNLSSIPDGATINSVTITPCASANKTGSSVMNVFYRWNGTNSSDAGSYSVTGTTPSAKTATAFNGLALVKGSASSLEVGAVLTSGSKGLRLGQISVQIDYTPLSAPSALSATTNGQSVSLAWTDNASNETGFKIERSADGINFSQINAVAANVVSFMDNPGAPGTYYYRVRAYNDAGNSSYSNTASAVIISIPGAPTNLNVYATSTTAILLWTDNASNETGFKVERGTDGVNFSQIGTTGVNVKSYYDNGLSAGTYYYRVRAYNAAGDSDYSNTDSIVIN